MHRQVVQQYADLHWSLHQIFVQQSNTMSLMNAVALQLNAAGDPMATAAAIAPIAKTLNTLNLYETRRRRALKTVQEELDLLTQAAAEAQAELRAKTTRQDKIGSVHSAPSGTSRHPEYDAEMDAIREQLRIMEAQGDSESAAYLRKNLGL
jgi:predicted  nucleic acid-binding Zn-ribbon protein